MSSDSLDEQLSIFDTISLEENLSCSPLPTATHVSASPPVDGRRVPEGERKYEIAELHDRHKNIARLASLGIPHKDIAEEVGCTPQTVSNTVNSSIVKRHIEKLHGLRDQRVIDSGKYLAELSPLAVEELRKGFNEDSGLAPNQRISLAQDILDRTNHGRTTKIQQEVLHAHMTLEDIADISALASKQAQEAGAIIVNAEVR